VPGFDGGIMTGFGYLFNTFLRVVIRYPDLGPPYMEAFIYGQIMGYTGPFSKNRPNPYQFGLGCR
jgi:hypothetical protein